MLRGLLKVATGKRNGPQHRPIRLVSSTLVALLGLSNSPGQKEREPELSKLLVKIPIECADRMPCLGNILSYPHHSLQENY